MYGVHQFSFALLRLWVSRTRAALGVHRPSKTARRAAAGAATQAQSCSINVFPSKGGGSLFFYWDPAVIVNVPLRLGMLYRQFLALVIQGAPPYRGTSSAFW
jgi:hypothetical protein